MARFHDEDEPQHMTQHPEQLRSYKKRLVGVFNLQVQAVWCDQ